MKGYLLGVLICVPILMFSQVIRYMGEVEIKRELPMSEVNGKSSEGIYRYYEKGEQEPFTGVLYAKYDNGSYSSWQEYVDGVGEGTWINYYPNGQYKEIGTYVGNRVEGPIKKFYSTGQLKAQGIYKDWRIRVGEWSFYDENGALETTTDYGTKGSIEEVAAYYESGEISYAWYSKIRSRNGF